jgi:hypothetical protein
MEPPMAQVARKTVTDKMARRVREDGIGEKSLEKRVRKHGA